MVDMKSRLVICGNALRLLHETTAILIDDLKDDVVQLLELMQVASIDQPRLDDFNYQLKASIRSLFGIAEAAHNSMVPAIIQSSGVGNLALTNSDRAILLERDYSEAQNILLPESRRYPLTRRLQTSFNLFVLASGASPLPLWDSLLEEHFKKLTRVRNRFTHSKKLEYLTPLPAFESFRQVALWLPVEISHVLAKAAEGVGQPAPTVMPRASFSPLPVVAVRPEDVFDDQFYREVFTRPAAAIQYIGIFDKQLHGDLDRALSRCSAALKPPYSEKSIGRVAREMVRVLSSNVEGMIGLASFFMRAVKRKGMKVSIPQSIRGEPVPARFVCVLNAFSAAFGENYTLECHGSEWRKFCTVLKQRDGLTHPRGVSDVNLGIDDLQVATSALGWLLKSQQAFQLDIQKIATCYGSRRQQ